MTPQQIITQAYALVRHRYGDRAEEIIARLPSYDPKTNYVGPEAWTEKAPLKPLARMARFQWGFDFNVPGWLHDGLYGIGGDERFRALADACFRELMMWVVRMSRALLGRFHRFLGRCSADALYAFVREGGDHFFNYHTPAVL